jgi:Tfp pilus assembly PilM family ATPase
MKEYITVKIGKEYIALVYLKDVKGKIQLIDCVSEPIGGLAQEAVSEIVKKFIDKNSPYKPVVINVFPSNLVMPKNIEIPSTDEKEIKDIIDLQAIRHTPYSSNEIVIDYVITGVFHNRYSKVMLVIAKKEIIEKQISILKLAKCAPDKIVLESECIARWCFQHLGEEPPMKPIAVVHFDFMSIDFVVIHNKKSIYIRFLPIDRKQFFQADPEAEKKFFAEIEKSLDAYNSENIESSLVKIYFIGLKQVALNFVNDIKDKLDIDSNFYSYLDSSSLPVFSDNFRNEYQKISFFPLVTAPLVLDDLELSLVPEDIKMQKEIQERAKDVTKVGVFIMLIIAVFLSILFTDIFFKNIYLNKINHKYIQENKKANMLKKISEHTNIVKRFLAKKGKVLEVLMELVNTIPEEVYFNSINLKEDDTLVITSTTDTMSRVFSLVMTLENNKNFKDVKVDFTKSRVVGGKEIADFGITMKLEK